MGCVGGNFVIGLVIETEKLVEISIFNYANMDTERMISKLGGSERISLIMKLSDAAKKKFSWEKQFFPREMV